MSVSTDAASGAEAHVLTDAAGMTNGHGLAQLEVALGFVRGFVLTTLDRVCVYDFNDGTVIYSNRDEDMSPSGETHWRTPPEVCSQLQGAKGDAVVEYRAMRQGPDGRRQWVFNREIVLSRDASGKPKVVMGASTDVTPLREAQAELLRLEERWQTRVGEDLHDVVGQSLSALLYLCKALEHTLAARGATEAAQAARLAELTRETLAQARALARGFCPVDLPETGLIQALKRYAENVVSIYGVRCEVRCSRNAAKMDAEKARHLYRIAIEATNNAMKHGKATHIVIRVGTGKGGTYLRVTDDGAGMPSGGGHDGMGIRIMRHRADLLGGTLKIRSKPHGGTSLLCSVRAAGTTGAQ